MTHVLIRSKRILLLTNPTVSLYLSPLLTLNFVAICQTNMSISFPIPPDVLITAAVSVAFSTSLALGPYSCNGVGRGRRVARVTNRSFMLNYLSLPVECHDHSRRDARSFARLYMPTPRRDFVLCQCITIWVMRARAHCAAHVSSAARRALKFVTLNSHTIVYSRSSVA